MRAELHDLEARRGIGLTESRPLSREGERAVAALRARKPAMQAGGVEAPESFRRGKPVAVRWAGKADGAPTLRYRVVDQSKRWNALEMSPDGDGYAATIPGDYLDTPYHLQLFVSARADGAPLLAPGLDDDLSNQPYLLVSQVS
jgi:hypothetical protein